MIKEPIKALFQRDLNKLKTEIELYKNEKIIWSVDQDISNSAGNLCLHLIGNLKTFVGAELGNTGYIRNRELEFSLKDVPRAELIKMVEETLLIVISTIDQLSDEDFVKEYPPVKALEGHTTVAYMLMHLSTHLSYHLGQINYHRRLLDHLQ